MYHEGQKIVCVNDDYNTEAYIKRIVLYDWEFPKKDEIYTVRKVFKDTILVEEIVNRIDFQQKKEPRFYFWHFKPLEELLDEIDLEEKLSKNQIAISYFTKRVSISSH